MVEKRKERGGKSEEDVPQEYCNAEKTLARMPTKQERRERSMSTSSLLLAGYMHPPQQETASRGKEIRILAINRTYRHEVQYGVLS